ncbi:MAG: hypothetical protein P9X24_16035 [Candidatus Hatepunaea meridiana]|nr:hypothetical protein [Candidatus Hatepunaea meridiana]
MGVIKDCSCPHGQPGGLARRKTVFDNIRKETPNAVFIDCGNLTDKNVNQELLRELLYKLQYDVICCYMCDYERLYSNKTTKLNPGDLPLLLCNYIYDKNIETLAQPLVKDDIDPSVLIISYTSQSILSGTDSTAISKDNKLLSWEDTINKYGTQSSKFNGIVVLVCNWDYNDTDMLTVPPTIIQDWKGLDVIIIGGSGFIEPEVKRENGVITVYPGIYGEYVLILDIWSENGKDISKFEWEVIPTETVMPDSTFEVLIGN